MAKGHMTHLGRVPSRARALGRSVAAVSVLLAVGAMWIPCSRGAERPEAGKALSVDLGGALNLELVLLPAGSFRMGSERGHEHEKPVHEVRFARPFYIGKCEVTQEQWQAVTGANPSRFKGPKNPVDSLSWNDCQEFLRKLNEKTGRKFSLPSEAEWEYACRAGSTTEFCFGDDEASLGDCAWYLGNSNGQTHPVGQKKPNAWGLHDMHGNLWEWCEDVWHNSHVGAPADGRPWLEGGDQRARVLRGGACNNDPEACRSASGPGDAPTSGSFNHGCRVVLRSF